MSKVVEIFIAYARKDSEYLGELRTHLAPLERSHRVKVWYDGKIEPGAVWEEAIKKHLHSSDIILLLVSADAIASDYFYDKELSDALKRHRAGEASVVPLIVRPCTWRATPLADLQAIPQNGRPVTDWPVRDNAYADAVESLWKMVERLNEHRKEQAETERRQQSETEAARIASKRRQREAAEEKKRLETERRQREADERLAKLERYKAEAKKNLNRRDWLLASSAAQAALQIAPEDAEARKLFEQAQQPTKYLPEPPKPPYLKWGAIAAGILLAVFIIFKVAGGSGESSESEPDIQSPSLAANLPAPLQKLETNMVPITGGTFTMGCKDAQRDGYYGYCSDWEKPSHQVHVGNFSIGGYEVTQAQWRAVMGSDPSYNKGCDECPVEQVFWEDIQEFIQKLNALTGKRYRLPAEAEWEYAARGGNQSKGYLYSGSNTIDEVAWYDGNYIKGNRLTAISIWAEKTTRPVGGKKPNELGLYDMSGNVWEWCEDDWHFDYNGAPADGSAWVDSPRGPLRVSRGGSWFDTNRGSCRVANRFINAPVFRINGVGFRLAL
ncbi:MAG: SUMF1/EgtB/PvdO family nonheme iron enzyme [Saprospiraceae bacterium]